MKHVKTFLIDLAIIAGAALVIWMTRNPMVAFLIFCAWIDPKAFHQKFL